MADERISHNDRGVHFIISPKTGFLALPAISAVLQTHSTEHGIFLPGSLCLTSGRALYYWLPVASAQQKKNHQDRQDYGNRHPADIERCRVSAPFRLNSFPHWMTAFWAKFRLVRNLVAANRTID